METSALVHKKNENRVSIQSSSDKKEKEQSKVIVYIWKILGFINKNYLPIALLFAVTFGALVPQPGIAISHKVTQYICVIGIFLYCGLYLRTSAIKEAIHAYIAVIYGILSILCVTCIIGGQLTMLLKFDTTYTVYANGTKIMNTIINGSNDVLNDTSVVNTSNPSIGRVVLEEGLGPAEFKSGLLVYFSMPCTISSGLLMVQQLNGNFALALLLTVVTNIVGIFTIPLFFQWMLTSATKIDFDVGSLLMKLALTLLLPIMVGKSIRCVKKVKDFVTLPKRKKVLRIINISLLAAITWMKVSKTSGEGGLERLQFRHAIFIVSWALLMHLLFLLINTSMCFVLRFKTDVKKCIIILASQKTLAVAIPVISFLPPDLGDQGMMAISLVICHISIIVFDAILIPIWLAVEKRRKKKKNETHDDDDNDDDEKDRV